VHSFSEPAEGFTHATRSAAAVGVTTIIEMPYDAEAPVVAGDVLDRKKDRLHRAAVVDVVLLGTIRKSGSRRGTSRGAVRRGRRDHRGSAGPLVRASVACYLELHIEQGRHAANQMAKIAPIGMLFATSRDGRSHCPEKWTEPDDIAVCLAALTTAVIRLDDELAPGLRP
jgi:hypothetical protein